MNIFIKYLNVVGFSILFSGLFSIVAEWPIMLRRWFPESEVSMFFHSPPENYSPWMRFFLRAFPLGYGIFAPAVILFVIFKILKNPHPLTAKIVRKISDKFPD